MEPIPPIPPLSVALEKQREEYTALLRGGLLPADGLPAVARAVEQGVLARGWEHAGDPADGERLYVLSVMGTHPRVKVGRGNAKGRIATHLMEYHVNGHGLVDAWISAPLPNAFVAEKATHMLARVFGPPRGYRREEYPNADFGRFRTMAQYFAWEIAQGKYTLSDAVRA